MRDTQLFTEEFLTTPWWWRKVRFPQSNTRPAIKDYDVIIIGAGYTGCHAALETLKAGLRTLVLDAQDFGNGCSGKNGGHLSSSIKPDLATLCRRHGKHLAAAIWSEGENALDYTVDFIKKRQLVCDLEPCGRLIAAHNKRQFRILKRKYTGISGSRILEKDQLATEIRTDSYQGGVIVDRVYALHPGKYLSGLLYEVMATGASIQDQTPVIAINHEPAGFSVQTPGERIFCRKIILATNGYTGPLSPWQQRRIIPIASSIIATEALGQQRIKQLIPGLRLIIDTRRLLTYYRPSPDGERILFGGRVSARVLPEKESAVLLHRALCQLFPELHNIRIEHSWIGNVAYTFDTLPHIGEHEGIHYAMGYCGSGVSLASYFGHRIGQKVAGMTAGKTALDNIPFQSRPGYNGDPWFLSPTITFNRLLDRIM